MKKFISVVVLFALLFITVPSMAQQVPRGMKYQAVARDKTGEVLANKKISLKISLLSGVNQDRIYYTEVHELVTNQFGLFDMVIGEGKVVKGEFKAIPWSQEDIWVQVSVKDDQKNDFITINNSKLLAVPYAFHAATASELVGKNGKTTDVITLATSPSTPWTTFGNTTTNPLVDKLGTNDLADLVIVTNGTERLRILSGGNINMKKTLGIGANLNVDSSVNLNIKGGSTINNGPFTVAKNSATTLTGNLTVTNQKPTLLSGTLTVDLSTQLNSALTVSGLTNLNSNLNVNNTSPTKLTGTLQVDGVTNLNNSVNVNNISPTVLTGTLRTDKDATFKQRVFLDNATHQSTSPVTGALVVNGGFGLGGNLNVGGTANFGGATNFGGAVAITDATESANTTTGALTITGGVGIGKKLNVGGATQLGSTLNVTSATTLGSTLGVTGATTLSNTLGVTGATTLNSTLGVTGAATLGNTLGVTGITTISNATQSTSASDGALEVAGGVGIGKNLNVGGALTTTGATTLNGALTTNGQVTITADPGGGESSESGYPLRVKGSGQGIAVTVSGSRTAANNFISFWDDNGMQGRIEGQTLDELHNDADYKSELSSRIYDVTSGAIDLLFATTDLAEAIADQISAATSVNACAGLGVVACPPIASLIAGSLVKVGLTVAQEIVVIADVAFSASNLAEFKSRKEDAIGISYQSAAGDYAEYLLREQASERISAGDIVGVKGGKVSKNTEGAEKVMVISNKPIVLGNLPRQGTEQNFEKVAFMGQVPVKVFGKVKLGDYIVANGANNGVGVAIAREKIQPKDIKNIVGIAWSEASKDFQFSTVNVAVGLNVNDNQKLIEKQQQQIDDLKKQIGETNSKLEKLISGFNAMSNTTGMNKPASPVAKTTIANQQQNPVALAVPSVPAAGNPNITYKEITRQDLINGFELAEQMAKANGTDVGKNVFWKRYKSDPSFKEFTLNRILTKYKEALQRQKEMDAKMVK